jgi:hypothetical protein
MLNRVKIERFKNIEEATLDLKPMYVFSSHLLFKI